MSTTKQVPEDGVDTLIRKIRAAQRLPDAVSRRRIRELAGVSMRDAANALNVNVSTFHRWEHGYNNPSRSQAIAYRRLLDALEEVAQ